jgi:hypothetical protein
VSPVCQGLKTIPHNGLHNLARGGTRGSYVPLTFQDLDAPSTPQDLDAPSTPNHVGHRRLETTAALIAQQIRGALEELGSESRPPTPAVAISLDPIGDTPARVRAFRHAASLTGRMEYLTGSTAQLRPVWHAYAAVPSSAGAVAYERGAFVLLLDREGAPRVYRSGGRSARGVPGRKD